MSSKSYPEIDLVPKFQTFMFKHEIMKKVREAGNVIENHHNFFALWFEYWPLRKESRVFCVFFGDPKTRQGWNLKFEMDPETLEPRQISQIRPFGMPATNPDLYYEI